MIYAKLSNSEENGRPVCTFNGYTLFVSDEASPGFSPVHGASSIDAHAMIDNKDTVVASILVTDEFLRSFDLKSFITSSLSGLAKKVDVDQAVVGLAKASDVTDATKNLATSSDVTNATKNLATSSDVKDAVKNLATSTNVTDATKNLATKSDVTEAVSPLATTSDLSGKYTALVQSYSEETSTRITALRNVESKLNELAAKVTNSITEWVKIAAETANQEIVMQNAEQSFSQAIEQIQVIVNRLPELETQAGYINELIKASNTISDKVLAQTEATKPLTQILGDIKSSFDSYVTETKDLQARLLQLNQDQINNVSQCANGLVDAFNALNTKLFTKTAENLNDMMVSITKRNDPASLQSICGAIDTASKVSDSVQLIKENRRPKL